LVGVSEVRSYRGPGHGLSVPDLFGGVEEPVPAQDPGR